MTNNIKLLCFATSVNKLLLHSTKIELRQGIQKIQVKTSVGTTLVGPPCRYNVIVIQ